MTLQSFKHQVRAALGIPVLGNRSADPGQCSFGRIITTIHCARHAHPQRQRRLNLNGHVGQHVLHQRLFNEAFLKH